MSFLDKARPVQQIQGDQPTSPLASKPTVSFASKIRPVATSTPAPVNDVKGGFVGDVLTGNTQRFGKTIGESIAAPANAQKYSDVMEQYTKTQNDLIKLIKNKKAANQDTTRLEEALHQHTQEAPKLEDFTGDVINKTTGQVLGEAGGTALEVLPLGTFGNVTKGMKSFQVAEKAVPTVATAAKTLVTKPSKFLTKEGAKQVGEGAAFGYGYDVSQGLQGNRGEDRTGAKALTPGLGTALGAIAPVAVKGIGKGVEKVRSVISDRATKAAGEADHLIGTIIQGEAKDIPAARKAFQEIDTDGVKTYTELKDALNTKIKTGSEKLREALDFEPYVKPLDELNITTKAGDVTVSRNFVDDSINQLEDYYTKTGNYEEAAKMKALRNKATTQGITVQEINDLAIKHGQDLNAFNTNGELASGLKKQLAENTRAGLKKTAREQFNSKVYNETDEALSNLIKTRNLIDDMEASVLKLQQKTRDATLGERAGALLEQVLNFTTFGTSRGFLQSGRDLGLFKAKTSMTSLELQERLAKNLKRINEIVDSPADTMVGKLEKFLQENKIVPAKPPKLQKESLGPKPAKIGVGKEIKVGVTSFRGTPVKTVAETAPYYETTRAKGFENSLRNPEGAKITVGEVRRVAGSWEGSIEPSFSATVTGSMSDALSYAADHAMKANQDAVILFSQGKGKGAEYIYKIKSSPDAALKKLHSQGISGATIDGKDLVVYDADGGLTKQLDEFTKLIGVKPTKNNGTVKLIFKEEYPKYQRPSAKAESKNSIPTEVPKVKGSKGLANIGAILAGAGLTASAMLPGAASRMTSVTYKAPPEQPKIEVPKEKIANAILHLESSGGTNKASADPGEMRWLTGLTRVAVKELKRLGLLDHTFNENKKEDVISASLKYFNHLQKKHPDKSPAEVYVDHYWTQATSSAQRQKKIDEFNKLINS